MIFWFFFRAQNDRLVIGYLMGAEIFEFRPNFDPWQLFKERNRQGILMIFSIHHNFGLEWTIWTFSVLKMIVLSLAIWWADIYFEVGLIWACGGCSHRGTIKVFLPILPHHFLNPHNFGLEWTFRTFSVLKVIVLSLAIRWAHKNFSFGLICACGSCSISVPIKADLATFEGGLLFCRFYFGMLPTKWSH